VREGTTIIRKGERTSKKKKKMPNRAQGEGPLETETHTDLPFLPGSGGQGRDLDLKGQRGINRVGTA